MGRRVPLSLVRMPETTTKRVLAHGLLLDRWIGPRKRTVVSGRLREYLTKLDADIARIALVSAEVFQIGCGAVPPDDRAVRPARVVLEVDRLESAVAIWGTAVCVGAPPVGVGANVRRPGVDQRRGINSEHRVASEQDAT